MLDGIFKFSFFGIPQQIYNRSYLDHFGLPSLQQIDNLKFCGQ